jgi:hypothetical protein
MAVRVLVRVDRKAALKAILALDAMSDELIARRAPWPKRLKRKYKEARHELLAAIGHFAFCAGLPDTAPFSD